MYAALARAVLDEAAAGRAAAEVEKLRRRHPRASRDEIARRLIRRAGVQCASASALMTGPAAFFGSVPFGADLAWQVVALNRLVLSLAALYGVQPSPRHRTAGLIAAGGAGLASEALRQGLVRLLPRLLPRRPGVRTAFGALAGMAIGYGLGVAVGGWARDEFRRGRIFAPVRRALA